MRTVEKGKAFLGSQRNGFDAGSLERLGTGEALASRKGLALADEHEAHVGERGQIAGSAHRALPRNDGDNVGIDERRQRLHGCNGNAGCPLRQRVELHQHDEADHARFKRRADARRVGAHDVDLQPRQVRRGDPRLGQFAETGVDAIDRVTGAKQPLHRLGAADDQRLRLCGEFDRDGAGQRGTHLGKRQRLLANADHCVSLFTAER